LCVEDHSLAIREDANGMWRQKVVSAPEVNCGCICCVVVSDESNTQVCSKLLNGSNLHDTYTNLI